MSLVSFLFFLLVPKKHVLLYLVTSCRILSFTSQVHLLLTCYASYLPVIFLYSHCLLLSRQRLNYRLHDLFLFLLQQRCHVKMWHMISTAWRCGIWWYQRGEDEDPFSQILLFRPLNWMISKLLKSDLFWAWCYVFPRFRNVVCFGTYYMSERIVVREQIGCTWCNDRILNLYTW